MAFECKVIRSNGYGRATIGVMFINGESECYTLEDLVREVPGEPVSVWKQIGSTAIPAGKYDLTIDWSDHFGRNMPHVLDVPGFVGIRIHPGNTEQDTEGCILVGSCVNSSVSIGYSRDAFNTFMPKLEAAIARGDKPTIEVVNNFLPYNAKRPTTELV